MVLPSFTGFLLCPTVWNGNLFRLRCSSIFFGLVDCDSRNGRDRYLVLPSFTGFYWVFTLMDRRGCFVHLWCPEGVIPTTSWLVLRQRYRVLPNFTEFYRVLPSFTGFRLMATGRGERPVREKALGPRAVAMATALAFHLVGLLRRR